MIERSDYKRESLVSFSYLVLAVLLIFQISMISGVSESVGEKKSDSMVVAQEVEIGQEISVKHKSVTVYQVEAGDSLFWIAATYGISIQELQKLNNLDSDVIRVGQRLIVPIDRLKHYPVGVTLSAQEVEWLAQMIYAEARGEPYLGQVAVGAVIINRMLNSQFPNTLRGVLFQQNAFQPMQNGSFYMTPDENARKAAFEALNGRDPTGGALFFFNPRQSSDRFMHSRVAKITIGSHRFTN